MPLHADVAALLDGLAAAPALSDGTPAQARKNYDAAIRPEPDELARVEDSTVPGPAGDIPVRLYAASTTKGLPIVVFFHGGGWVLSSLDGHDAMARRLADRSGALVVSVDYRLAPEHHFPAPFDDCWAVTSWIADNGSTIGGDPRRMAVAGDSAGGNLAAAVALRARDTGLELAFQLLIYPCIDDRADTPSMTENATGYFLTAKDMGWFWDQYVPQAHRTNPYAVPGRARNVRGCAPALIQTAEFDPLRDEGERYARRLAASGVPVEVTRYDGLVHGFFARWHQMAGALPAHDEAGAALAQAFGLTR